MEKKLRNVPHHNVEQTAGFWAKWFATNRDTTLDAVYDQFRETGRIEALKLHWKEGDPHRPHIFFDSDIAKWAEAAAYVLHYHRDANLETRIEEIVDLIEAGQEETGYFNSYFLQIDRNMRWQRRQDHELYCAGHLLEAAIAYVHATGRARFLDLMTRYIDYIHQIFYVERSAAFNTPGHQEIELALVKLYRRCGEQKYLDLAAYFIDTRGRKESQEAKLQELDPYGSGAPGYGQDQAPVAEQIDAQGHSVRFGYLFSAAADLAYERKDPALADACRRVLRDVVDRRIYVTGGVGNLAYGEAYGAPYVLPNKEAYTETCASISIAMLCSRMLALEANGEWGDLMELELYNGALAGISLSGDAFAYENPLEVLYRDVRFKEGVKAPTRPYERQKYFPCSCCPPNIARVIASIGGYQYTTSDDAIFVHLYSASSAEIDLDGSTVGIRQTTDYPWNGDVDIRLSLKQETRFTLALRIPAWCPQSRIEVNGEEVYPSTKEGYAYVERSWKDGDTIRLSMPLEIVEFESHPLVAEDAGKVAVKVGPIVYCAEEADNGERLWDFVIDRNPEYEITWRDDILGGVNTVAIGAKLREDSPEDDRLYRAWNPRYSAATLRLIPYYAWGNREAGNMTVWLRKE